MCRMISFLLTINVKLSDGSDSARNRTGGGEELCKNICKWIKNLSPPAHANVLGSLGDIFRPRNPNGTDRGLERWKCKDSLGSCDQRLLLLSFSSAI